MSQQALGDKIFGYVMVILAFIMLFWLVCSISQNQISLDKEVKALQEEVVQLEKKLDK